MKGGDRHQVVVHIDEATLRKGEAGRCEIDDGPAIPVETARRLSCDCSKVEITEDEQGEPLDVGRKTRTIPPAMRRALASRDKGCVFPGCNHKRYVDGHHIEHWADGGETKLSNLATLCRFHHRAVHEGGLKMERCDDGAWRFTNARGESLHGCAPGHTQPLADWRASVGRTCRARHQDRSEYRCHRMARRTDGLQRGYRLAVVQVGCGFEARIRRASASACRAGRRGSSPEPAPMHDLRSQHRESHEHPDCPSL